MFRQILFGAGLLFAANAQAVDVPGPLVTPGWVADNRGEVAVIDVRRKPASFAEGGHIGDAALAEWGRVRSEQEEGGVRLRKMLPDEGTFRDMMRAWGVDQGEAVVITAPGTSPGHVAHMARLYWQMKYHGHDNVALLDGGNVAWMAAGNDLEKGETTPEEGDFQVREQREELLATTEDVVRIVEEGGARLVDSRPLAYYLGLAQKSYVKAPGHIPGAKPMPFHLYVGRGKKGLQMRPAEELRDYAKAMGVNLDQPVVTYCNSGSMSTVGWFVFQEILDTPEVRVYDGSMHAWTKDAERPTTTMRME